MKIGGFQGPEKKKVEVIGGSKTWLLLPQNEHHESREVDTIFF